MMGEELSLAILWLHFLTLRKWNKAISEVEAYGASEEIATKEGCLFCRKMQYYHVTHSRGTSLYLPQNPGPQNQGSGAVIDSRAV